MGGVFFKNIYIYIYMHNDNVGKKKQASADRSQKKYFQGMRLIYIIYVNLGKTGFVECTRKL